MKYYSYNEFADDIRSLGEMVRPFDAEAIVAVARGGLMMSQLLAHALHLRNVQSIRTEGYDGDRKLENVKIFGSCDLEGLSRVLVVDDIVDSGDTLDVVLCHLKAHYPAVEFRSAAIFYKPTAVVQPDYAIREADGWINFFWEADFA